MPIINYLPIDFSRNEINSYDIEDLKVEVTALIRNDIDQVRIKNNYELGNIPPTSQQETLNIDINSISTSTLRSITKTKQPESQRCGQHPKHRPPSLAYGTDAAIVVKNEMEDEGVSSKNSPQNEYETGSESLLNNVGSFQSIEKNRPISADIISSFKDEYPVLISPISTLSECSISDDLACFECVCSNTIISSERFSSDIAPPECQNSEETISIVTVDFKVDSRLGNESSVSHNTDHFTKYCLHISTDDVQMWSHDEIYHAQKNDRLCQLLIKYLKKTLTDTELISLKKEFKRFDNYRYGIHNRLLCRIVDKPEDRTVYQTYVPPPLRSIALRLSHNVPSAGHGGIATTHTRLNSFAFWPKSMQHVVHHIKNCIICLQFKAKYGPKAPILRMYNTSRPFERIHVDLIGKLLKADGFEYILTVIDARTRYLIAVPLRNKCAKTVARALFERVIAQYGPMETIISDCGAEFTASIWQSLMEV